MILKSYEINDFSQTGRVLQKFTKKYFSDLGNMISWDFLRFYNFVRNLPYIPDPENQEAISRPKFLLNGSSPWCDCDDKTLLIGCWCYANKCPVNYVLFSSANDCHFHHIYPEVSLVPDYERGGEHFPIVGNNNELAFFPADATFKHLKLGEYLERPTALQTLVQL